MWIFNWIYYDYFYAFVTMEFIYFLYNYKQDNMCSLQEKCSLVKKMNWSLKVLKRFKTINSLMCSVTTKKKNRNIHELRK